MAEARQQCQWRQTATIVAMLANTVRDPKKRKKPFTPDEFDPFNKASKAEPLPTDWKVLAATWKGLLKQK